MLRTERPDYRRSREADLLAGLRSKDPLALAESYHRTSAAAHACARRLLGGARAAEALMEAVYSELWASPPEAARLESWVRSRCFRIGAAHLREVGEPPAAPSLVALLPGLPEPEHASLDAAEQALADLPESTRLALLLAHDQGVPATVQDDPGAVPALDRALIALAGPGEGTEEATAQSCADLVDLADWTLGLLDAEHAARIAAEVAERPPCAARSRALRRGRRRIEGLPPAPDMGQRILAAVLAASPPATSREAALRDRSDGPPVTAGAPAPGALDAPQPPAGAPSPGGAPLASALDEEGDESPPMVFGGAPVSPPVAEPSPAPPEPPPPAPHEFEDDAAADEPFATAPDTPDDVIWDEADEAQEPPFAEDGRPAAEALGTAPLDTGEESAAPTAKRGLLRRVLYGLLVLLVLVAGGALGVYIGLLVVGGR